MKAIKVTWLAATDKKPSRLKASIADESGQIASVTIPSSYESADESAMTAANKLIKKMGWNSKISGVGVYGGDFYVTLRR